MLFYEAEELFSMLLGGGNYFLGATIVQIGADAVEIGFEEQANHLVFVRVGWLLQNANEHSEEVSERVCHSVWELHGGAPQDGKKCSEWVFYIEAVGELFGQEYCHCAEIVAY